MSKLNKFTFLLSLCGMITACASEPLTADKAQQTYIEPTTLSQADAYSGAQVWLAKNLGDSNAAIKVRDQQNYTLVTNMMVDCPELKYSGIDFNTHKLRMNLEVQTKDKRIRSIYTAEADAIYSGVDGRLLQSGVQLNAGNAEAIKACTERTNKALITGLQERKQAAKSDW